MREIDKLHLEYPFAGARMLRDLLKGMGYSVGRRHVGGLKPLMGLEALYRKKKGTTRNPERSVFPRTFSETSSPIGKIKSGQRISATSRCAAAFCTCLRCWIGVRGKVLAWRLSNSLTTDCCIDAVEEAMATYGTLAIFNTDQVAKLRLSSS